MRVAGHTTQDLAICEAPPRRPAERGDESEQCAQVNDPIPDDVVPPSLVVVARAEGKLVSSRDMLEAAAQRVILPHEALCIWPAALHPRPFGPRRVFELRAQHLAEAASDLSVNIARAPQKS